MNDAQKAQFITVFLNTLSDNVTRKISAIPENWDGPEIAAYVDYQLKKQMPKLDNRRKRSFNNDLLVNPL